jgi:hypothetical protein
MAYSPERGDSGTWIMRKTVLVRGKIGLPGSESRATILNTARLEFYVAVLLVQPACCHSA